MSLRVALYPTRIHLLVVMGDIFKNDLWGILCIGKALWYKRYVLFLLLWLKLFLTEGINTVQEVSNHLSNVTAQVLQFLLHSLQSLQKVVILLRQPLVLLKHGLHLALCLSHPLQLDKERKQWEEVRSSKFLPYWRAAFLCPAEVKTRQNTCKNEC